eukprot:1159164-Pelagomonas_calceolata.AAC.6
MGSRYAGKSVMKEWGSGSSTCGYAAVQWHPGKHAACGANKQRDADYHDCFINAATLEFADNALEAKLQLFECSAVRGIGEGGRLHVTRFKPIQLEEKAFPLWVN